jgi:hypothetical protein
LKSVELIADSIEDKQNWTSRLQPIMDI